MNSVEKQELTETVAGKTQRALFTAIMTNFDTAVGATEAALNSEGSALEENNKRMDSLQGRLKQLDSAWQSFSRNTINSEWVKNILNATTELIKFTDKIGGLPVVLAVATSALMLFKGGLILDKSFKIFNSGLDLIKNGITTLVTALPNAISAFRAFSAGIISAGTAIQAAVPLLSVIALAITGVVAGINAFTKAQEEATAAAIEDSQEASKIIENKTKQKETIEDEIKKLKEEKDAYINSAKAKGKDINNDEWIKSKDEEISKRQENIEKINQEIKKQLEQREAAARSITFKKADKSGLGQGNIFANVSGEDYNKYIEIMDKGNEKLKEAGTNTGAYNRILEEYRAEINKTIKEKEDSNQSTHAETEAIKEINKELERNSKKYEEDAKSAEELYDILKSGGTISQEQINWLEKFYNLNDEQINQLKTGVDVLNDTTTATENQTKETSNLTEEQQKLLEKYNDVTDAIKTKSEAIDKEQKSYNTLKSAVDEYNESGYLSIDTLQSLLSLDDEHLAMLSLQNGQLVLNTTSLDNMTDALIAQRIEQLQTAATQDLYNLALGNTSSLSSTAEAALNNLENQTSGIGSTFSSQVQGINEFTNALLQAKAAAGADTNVSDYQAEANAIISSYQDVYKKITTLGSGTTRAGGTSGKRHRYTGSSKSKKSGSKSSKEAYKAEVDVLYKYENALDNAKDAVDRLNDALKNTDNFNEREKYLKQLIEATRKEIDATNDLRDAQTRQINDYINQLRRQGFQISYNSKTNELNINNMEKLGKFSGDTAKNLEKMIKKIQDLNKDNRSLSGSVRDLNADIEDFNEQLEELPTEKLEKFNELMEKFQQSRLDQIQNQIDDIQHEMENDPRLKALKAQIEALEKQNDELDSQKELEEKILAVEQAKDKLANQRKQKTIQIYREGQGFVWESDISAIQDAADELKDAQNELNDKIKQDQLDQLNAEKDALEKSYEDRIDALQNFLDDQNYLIDKANREGIKTFEELQKQMAQFGLDNAENLKKATDWLNNYNQSLSDLNKTVSGILSSSTTATDGLIYSSGTQDRINNALSSIIPNIDTSTGLTLSNVRTEATNKDTTSSIYINSIELPNVKDIDDFIKALKDLPRMASSQSTLRV